MSDARIAGIGLGVAALILGALIVSTLRSGEIVGKYGTEITRAAAPRRFWAGMIAFMLLDALLAMFAALAFLHGRG